MNQLSELEAHAVQSTKPKPTSPQPQWSNKHLHNNNNNPTAKVSPKSPKPKFPKVLPRTGTVINIHPNTIAAATNAINASQIPVSSPSARIAKSGKNTTMDTVTVNSNKEAKVTSTPTVSGPSEATQDEMAEALLQLKNSSVPQDLTNFLAVFQKGVKEGFDFLSKKSPILHLVWMHSCPIFPLLTMF